MNWIALVIVLVAGQPLINAPPIQAQETVDAAATEDPTKRQLDISLLFHANQDLVPLAELASKTGYVGLLEVLRAHPDSRFQIQISGTLLNALTWFDDRAIRLIREGVDAGQFEILGSTYSQNVMYASNSDFTNGVQIDTHLDLLERIFGVEPTGFWNPERTWKQPFVHLIASRGFQYVPVETHILVASGVDSAFHAVRRTTHGEFDLTVVHDDTRFLQIFDRVVNGGPIDTLEAYLRALYEADTNDEYLVAYFQDAEATGFWQYSNGEDFTRAWRNLDSLLTIIEGWDWVRITTAEEFLATNQPVEEVTPIVEAAANWMNVFAQELGYADWFDYWKNDSLQIHFRDVVEPVRDSLEAMQAFLTSARIRNPVVERLFRRALRTFIAHEYEYGASWGWRREWADFHLTREALVSLTAARHALRHSVGIYERDINSDGWPEIVMTDSTDLFVLTAHGGRLLYWFDLLTGESLVGNENFGYYMEDYEHGAGYLPEFTTVGQLWPWLGNNASLPEIFGWTFEMRRRALNDWIYFGGVLVDSLVHRVYDVSLSQGEVRFSHSGSGVAIHKIVTLASGTGRHRGLDVRYEVSNASGEKQAVTMVIENGLSPSYLSIMDGGPGTLAYWGESAQADAFDPMETTGVVNAVTGQGVRLEWPADAAPFYVETDHPVFGLEVNPLYSFLFDRDGSQQIRFGLRRYSIP